MKKVMIAEKLFVALVRYFVLEQTEVFDEIKKELEEKVEVISMRELYTQYKTAPTEEEREKARKKYLDNRGVRESFRW